MALISWIEKDGELLYLTDREYQGRDWRRCMIGLKDADPIGHGAIHHFYDFSGGKSYTEREFWVPLKLPSELWDLVRTERRFDKNFKNLFLLSSNNDLAQMAVLGPSWLGKKTIKELSQRKNIEPNLLTYLYNNTPLMYWPGVIELVSKCNLKVVL